MRWRIAQATDGTFSITFSNNLFDTKMFVIRAAVVAQCIMNLLQPEE